MPTITHRSLPRRILDIRAARLPHGRGRRPVPVTYRVGPRPHRARDLGPRAVGAGPANRRAGAGARSSAIPGTTVGRRGHVLAGSRDILPLVVGVLPIGLAVGATIGTSETVPRLAGWAGGPVIVGGAAQLLTIRMLDAGAAPAAILLSALLVNARVLMYGAALAPWFRETSRRRRLLVAFPLIDPTFLVSISRFERGDLDQSARLAYYAGAATTLMVAWTGIQALAIAAGGVLPEAVGLHLAAPLAFAGLLAKSVSGRPALAAAGSAGLVAVAGTGLPFQAGGLLALLVGIAAGVWFARRDRVVTGEVSA
jgi:predicted branched-subunit amino acid permease